MSRLIAIRGATTTQCNSAYEIRAAAIELFEQIVQANSLTAQQIVSVTASTTADLTALYPVAAIRQACVEWSELTYFSCLEPAVQGLKRCIRLLVYAYAEAAPVHVYLKEAKDLKNKTQHYNIAIDGPSGAGKSTAARELANRLSIAYLDTGAMYRAAAVFALEQGLELNEQKICEALSGMSLEISYQDGIQEIFLCGKNITDKIHTPQISILGNKISRFACVREKLTKEQREIAAKISCVLDGRDIGTVVLPHAKYKFFLTANENERAQRRTSELLGRGENVSFEQVLHDISLRDHNDTTRKIAPLRQAQDAILIDSSGMSVQQVVDRMLEHIK